jgi:hypothetical protein
MKAKASRLWVRRRRIFDGTGGATTMRSVLCPTFGQATALSVCAECAQCESIDDRAVICHPEKRRPTMRWTPLLGRMLP